MCCNYKRHDGTCKKYYQAVTKAKFVCNQQVEDAVGPKKNIAPTGIAIEMTQSLDGNPGGVGGSGTRAPNTDSLFLKNR